MALRMCIHRFPVYDNGKTLVLSFSLLYPFLYDWLNEKNTFERSIASDNNGIFNVVKSTSCRRACVKGRQDQSGVVHSGVLHRNQTLFLFGLMHDLVPNEHTHEPDMVH